ncbi:MAG TPA: DUF4440 domain-containing protein [Bryobacteraceae bacterium]|nr:DUF4440 domain-containing protein [Bryobacteraceae bacterium]
MQPCELSDQIIAIERRALDRWGTGDPYGYLEIDAPEITYFDPAQEKRVDGLAALTELLAPLAGTFRIDRYEMIDPKVQVHGEIAVLSYNLVSTARLPDGGEATVRWNSTEVYARLKGEWKIIHNHWSYIKPELKQPGSQ